MDRVSALRLIREEHERAMDKFGKFKSPHEGLSIIREEYKELEREVFSQFDKRDIDKMRKEATQLGAMALRFMVDIT